MTDLIDAHRRALLASIDIVAPVTADDLGRPTPCAGWDLGRLLAHMVGQNHGFAAAVEGVGADLAVFADRPVGTDPAGDYAGSARRAIEAFGAPGLLDREVVVAVLRSGTLLPARVVVGAHLVDYVVHGWDVARALGRPAAYDDDVLRVALAVAEAVPDAARSDSGDTAFRPTVPTASPDLLDQVVANLGRCPEWVP